MGDLYRLTVLTYPVCWQIAHLSPLNKHTPLGSGEHTNVLAKANMTSLNLTVVRDNLNAYIGLYRLCIYYIGIGCVCSL